MLKIKENRKEIIIFHRLCKDLFKYIQNIVIKKYISPNNKNLIDIDEENDWKYFNEDENISNEEKVINIFKDNFFLQQVQKIYQPLKQVIMSLDDNKKSLKLLLMNNEEKNKQQMELLSNLNLHLNKFFQNEQNKADDKSTNSTLYNIEKDDNFIKSLNIINELYKFSSFNNLDQKDDNKSEFSFTSNNSSITNRNNEQNTQGNNSELFTIEDIEMKPISFETEYSICNYELNSTPKFLNKKNKRESNLNNEEVDYIEIDFNDDLGKKNNRNYPKNRRKKINKSKEYSKTIVKANKKNNYQKNYSFPKNVQRKNINDKNKSIPKIAKLNNVASIDPGQINNKKAKKRNEYTEMGIKEKIEEKGKGKENDKQDIEININNEEKSPETEFEKILKQEFPSIYDESKNYSFSNKEIIRKINTILRKIKSIKFKSNKFEDPYLIGSYSHFDVMHLLKYFPPIDILFKCKQINNMEELKNISTETMKEKLCLDYEEVLSEVDKKNEIILISNRCEIKLKNKNNFYIRINLYFVISKIGIYNKKEQCINKFVFGNNIWKNKAKIVLFLYFRRWRRKFELFFIMPEFLDILINNYFNEKESIPNIIQKIFYYLFDGETLFTLNGNNIFKDDEKNMEVFSEFINEINNKDEKNNLNDAIITTQKYIMSNDFYSTFNNGRK